MEGPTFSFFFFRKDCASPSSFAKQRWLHGILLSVPRTALRQPFCWLLRRHQFLRPFPDEPPSGFTTCGGLYLSIPGLHHGQLFLDALYSVPFAAEVAR